MFEAAEVGNETDKNTYKKELPALRAALLQTQKRLAASKLSVVLIVSGVEGAGKPETVSKLLEWIDARGVQTHAFWDPSDEERDRPFFWRFQRVLPRAGNMAIFFGSWYSMPIVQRAFDKLGSGPFDQQLDRIVEQEHMLALENVVLVKVWLHMSKKQVRKHLEKLESKKSTAWRVTPMDRDFFKRYDDFRAVSEHALRRTSTADAPWHVIEAADARYRELTVARTLMNAINARLDAHIPHPHQKPALPVPHKVNILRKLDLTLSLEDEEYEKRLLKWQGELNRLTRQLHDKRRSLIAVFEGADAAGKGGAIRRLTAAIDARQFRVIPIAAPTDDEKGRPYLWRFWNHLPRLGRVTIYDRSWYGRVLVERIEGFCAPQDWQRAYAEINAFEDELTRFGITLVKFWLHISPQEQLKRFKDREITPYKQYKITEEDWRNRAKWEGYEAAACDMIERTSTEHAPWTLVEANDKNWARVKILKTVCKRLEQALEE